MIDNGYVAVAVVICAVITWALRAVPFALLRPIQESDYLHYLGERMPLGIMTILAVHTLKHTELTTQGLAISGAAVALTIGLHLWKRNFILSVFAGTAAYTIATSWAQAGITP